MCQIDRKDNKQIDKIGFYVYKRDLVLGNTFISLYQKYIYRIKRNNPIISLKPVEDNYGMIKIEDGYHFYKEIAIEFCQNPNFRAILNVIYKN